MQTIYEVIDQENAPSYIKRTDEDGKVWSIPLDPANSDYQEYLKSLDEANTL